MTGAGYRGSPLLHDAVLHLHGQAAPSTDQVVLIPLCGAAKAVERLALGVHDDVEVAGSRQRPQRAVDGGQSHAVTLSLQHPVELLRGSEVLDTVEEVLHHDPLPAWATSGADDMLVVHRTAGRGLVRVAVHRYRSGWSTGHGTVRGLPQHEQEPSRYQPVMS